MEQVPAGPSLSAEPSSHSTSWSSWLYSTVRRVQPLSGILENIEEQHTRAGVSVEHQMETIRQEDIALTTPPEASGETSSEASSSHNSSLSTVHARSSSQRTGGQVHAAEPATVQGDSPAASAERHRLEASGTIDVQVIARWLEKSGPFLALLFIIFLRQHWLGILVSGCLTINLRAANIVLREQVKLKERRSKSRLWSLALGFAIQSPAMIITVKAISSQDLWPRFIFWMPSPIPTAWHAAVLAIAVDTLARCMGASLKAAVLALLKPSPDEAFRRRSSILTFLEHLLLCYRMMLTSPIWLAFFYNIPGAFVSKGMTGLYLALKLQITRKQIGMAFAAARVASSTEALFGRFATCDEVMENGNSCAICQESMAQPVKLSCSHIFCNGCILEWFERECTCPMCRAEIKPKGLTSHGDGTTALLPQVF